MSDIEDRLRATFTTHLDGIEAGLAIPVSVRVRARRARTVLLAASLIGIAALVIVAASTFPRIIRDAPFPQPEIGNPISPMPIVLRENGRITYGFTGGLKIKLHSINPDGSGRRTIPTPEGSSWSHSWSPDGSKLAVSMFPIDEGPRTIWVMNEDGSDPHQIASAENVSVPSWSPDGKWIAYSADTSSRTAIHVVRADGSDDQVVHVEGAEGAFSIFSAKISPDGTQILFDRGTDAGFDIFSMDIDGTEVRRLTTTGDDYDPSWSPDGSEIAFTREDDSKADANTNVTSDIFLMDADGDNIRRLTRGGPKNTNLHPVWSPDGTRIVYVAGVTGGPGGLVVMNADGSSPTELVARDVLGVSWQAEP
jgi:Tol biopolymer transport system component